MKVSNMTSSRGNAVPNQFIIAHERGMFHKTTVFQSYNTTIAKRTESTHGTTLQLDRDLWDYSRTTSKYRNQFTGLTTAQTKAGIKDGSIKLVDLN